MTFEEAVTAYKTYARAEGKSPATVAWVSSSIRYFTEFLGPELPEVQTVTGDDLRRFVIALRERPKFTTHPYNRTQTSSVSLQSIDTYCRGIRSLFAFLAREGFLKSDPLAKVRLPKVPEIIIPTFTEKECVKLLRAPNRSDPEGYRDYAMMLTMLDTALRLGEIHDMDDANIDFDENQIRIMGKMGRERVVPFGRKVGKVLIEYKLKYRPEGINTTKFWLGRDGHPLSMKRMEKIVRSFGKKAGLTRCYPHKLRHTSAVLYLRNGGDIFSLQKKLGHRSLTMTRHYANLADSDVRDQHFKYGVADRLRL